MDRETFYSDLLTWEEKNIKQLRPFQFLDLEIKDIELPYVIDYDTQFIFRLQYIDFINSTISNSKFSRITFEKLDFFGRSFLEESQFEYCKFENTDIIAWSNNTYSECEFNNCKIDLTFSFKSNNKINSFKNCSFKNCQIQIADLNHFDNCSFENTSLNRLIINNNPSQNEYKFINCKIAAIEFTQDVISGFHFIKCVIQNHTVYIWNKTLNNCTFNGINLSINNCKGENINFNDSFLSISGSQLPNCSFRGAKVNAGHSTLESGIFYNSKIGDISNCVLDNSSFLMANLTKAKINECKLNNVDFTDILLDSNIDSKSYIDNIFFAQISTNILGFNKLTYCPILNKIYLKFETSYIPKELDELKAVNFTIRKYEIDFFREQPFESSSRAETLTLITSPEDLVLIINSLFINREITEDSLIALKIGFRGVGSLGDKIVEIPQNHFKLVGEKLVKAISFLTTFKDSL